MLNVSIQSVFMLIIFFKKLTKKQCITIYLYLSPELLRYKGKNVIFPLAKLSAIIPATATRDNDRDSHYFTFTLATLSDTTQIEMILSVWLCPGWPRKIHRLSLLLTFSPKNFVSIKEIAPKK